MADPRANLRRAGPWQHYTKPNLLYVEREGGDSQLLAPAPEY
jgi:hypothetical protein